MTGNSLPDFVDIATQHMASKTKKKERDVYYIKKQTASGHWRTVDEKRNLDNAQNSVDHFRRMNAGKVFEIFLNGEIVNG